jgi:hypothetical protein
MAFPTKATAQGALFRGQGAARRLKGNLVRARAQLAQQDVPRSFVRNLLDSIRRERDTLIAVETTPGLAEYAKEQFADANLDVVAEWQAMRAAIDDCGAWIVANYPRSANGALEELTFDAQGREVVLQFTVAQTSGLRDRLDAVIATIN